MSLLLDLLSQFRQIPDHRPWPRVTVDEAAWRAASEHLAANRWALLGLWGDEAAVHAAVSEGDDMAVLSLDCTAGAFPSLGRDHAPAIRLERAIRDLWGLEPHGLSDRRPWLDHGRWDGRPEVDGSPAAHAAEYPFLPAEGESLHEIPVGPVHAGIIEPGHFRFSASGETVVRLEARLGYVHKGIEGLMTGATLT